MEEIRIGFWGLFVANVVLGFFLGTFPLVAGLLAGNRKYAFLGFVSTVAGGSVLGIFLSYPLALLFVWLILRKPADQGAVEAVESEPKVDAV